MFRFPGRPRAVAGMDECPPLCCTDARAGRLPRSGPSTGPVASTCDAGAALQVLQVLTRHRGGRGGAWRATTVLHERDLA
eukprot:371069-Prymnesium_polylepis.1